MPSADWICSLWCYSTLSFWLEHIAPTYYVTIITATNSLLIFAILWMMYRCGKFLKV